MDDELKENSLNNLPESEGRFKKETSSFLSVKSVFSQILQNKKIVVLLSLVILILVIGVIATLLKGRGTEEILPENQSLTEGADYNPASEINLPSETSPTSDEEVKKTSYPGVTVDKFFDLNRKSEGKKVAELLSSKAKSDTFKETLEEIESDESIYGKTFDYKIFNTYVEKGGNISRVSALITTESEIYICVYILLWEDGAWRLVDKEVYYPISSNS